MRDSRWIAGEWVLAVIYLWKVCMLVYVVVGWWHPNNSVAEWSNDKPLKDFWIFAVRIFHVCKQDSRLDLEGGSIISHHSSCLLWCWFISTLLQSNANGTRSRAETAMGMRLNCGIRRAACTRILILSSPKMRSLSCVLDMECKDNTVLVVEEPGDLSR